MCVSVHAQPSVTLLRLFMADKMKNNGGSMEAGTVLDREGGHEKKESAGEDGEWTSSSQLCSGRRVVIPSADCPGKQRWL